MFSFSRCKGAISKMSTAGLCAGTFVERPPSGFARVLGVATSLGRRLSVAALLCATLAACDAAQQRQASSTMDPLLRAICEAAMRSPGRYGTVSAEDRRLCANLSSSVTNVSVLIGGALAQALSPNEREKAGESTKRVLDAPPRPGTRETWSSPDTPGNRGGSELVRVEPGDNCRVVREVGYIQGREVVQDSRLCRNEGGGWRRVA
jgi:surface antigen